MWWKKRNVGQFSGLYRHGMTGNTSKSTWNFVPKFAVAKSLIRLQPYLAQSPFSRAYCGAQFDCASVDLLARVEWKLCLIICFHHHPWRFRLSCRSNLFFIYPLLDNTETNIRRGSEGMGNKVLVIFSGASVNLCDFRVLREVKLFHEFPYNNSNKDPSYSWTKFVAKPKLFLFPPSL